MLPSRSKARSRGQERKGVGWSEVVSNFKDRKRLHAPLFPTSGFHGVVIKEAECDATAWLEYLENVITKHGAVWRALYNASKALT